MPGSAVMGSNLVDDLVGVADELRADLYDSMGVTQYSVNLLTRTWTGSERGEGDYTDVRVPLEPAPLVKPIDEKFHLESHGRETQGAIRLEEISLTYTYDELTGGTLAANQEFWYELVDSRGQGLPADYYVLKAQPSTDRDKTIGWIVFLNRTEVNFP